MLCCTLAQGQPHQPACPALGFSAVLSHPFPSQICFLEGVCSCFPPFLHWFLHSSPSFIILLLCARHRGHRAKRNSVSLEAGHGLGWGRGCNLTTVILSIKHCSNTARLVLLGHSKRMDALTFCGRVGVCWDRCDLRRKGKKIWEGKAGQGRAW